jgi:hypothetical protein
MGRYEKLVNKIAAREKKIAEEILTYINDGKTQITKLLLPKSIRFVLCGFSSEYRSKAVERANKQLLRQNFPKIIETHYLMLNAKNLSQALKIIRDMDFEPQDSEYIGFIVHNEDLAKQLEINGVKVFWIDK